MIRDVQRGLHIRGSRTRHRTTATLLGIITALLALTSSAEPAPAPNLVSVVIRGSSVYDAPGLFAVYREQLGKPISADGARAIATALVAKYQHDGYAQPLVQLDDALLAAGVLRIDIFEPRISEVRITGDPGPHLERLEDIGAGLRGEQPLAQADLQSAVRRMRELPGLTLSASTERDDSGPNLYRLDLDTLFKRVNTVLKVSNRGTEEAGPVFLLGQVTANGLLGGRTSVGATFGSATDYAEYHGIGVLGCRDRQRPVVLHRVPVRSNPHEIGVDLDDVYLRNDATVTLSSRSRAVSICRSPDGRARCRRPRDRQIRRDVARRTAADAESGYSIPLAGQREDAVGELGRRRQRARRARRRAHGARPGRRSASSHFLLTHLSLTRLTRFGERWSVRLDALGQQSADVLPYDERFKIGGDRLGRGYEVAEIAGDQGIGAKVEVRRELLGAPALLERVAVYGFYDIGATWKHDEPGRESAARPASASRNKVDVSPARSRSRNLSRIPTSKAGKICACSPRFSSLSRKLRPYRTVRCWSGTGRSRTIAPVFANSSNMEPLVTRESSTMSQTSRPSSAPRERFDSNGARKAAIALLTAIYKTGRHGTSQKC